MRKTKWLLLLSFFIPFISFSQVRTTDNGYTIKKAEKAYGISATIKSKALKKEMPLLVFLPSKYKISDKRFPVVYLLHGVNDQPISDEGVRKLYHPETGVQEASDLFQVIIVTPIVGKTYYLNNLKDTLQKFASFIGEDLPTFIDSEYRTIKDRENRFLAGFSMGGYGAVSLLCRYPERFSVALSRGGVMDLAAGIHDLDWDEANIPGLGNYFNNQEGYHLNGCYNLANKIKGRKDVGIVLEVGREDFLYKCNYQFQEKLKEKNIPYVYAEFPGGHVWDSNSLLSLLSHLQTFRKTIF